MRFSSYSDVGILNLVSIVPERVVDNYDLKFFGEEEAKRIEKKSGIRFRRHVDENTCTSDLGAFAVEKLFGQGGVEKSDIDYLVFVTQTPDYRMPFTAALVHDRVGLREDCGAIDVNLGCSGFVYALDLAYSLVGSGAKTNVLVVNAETRSKVYSLRDKGTGLLFGDAASAVLVGRQEGAAGFFSCHTDGSGFENIMVPAGGYRVPSSPETTEIRQYEDGSWRSLENGTMNGINVFNFAISKVPDSIKSFLGELEVASDEVDFCVLHQANMMMNSMIAKKLKIPSDKLLSSIEHYGNTSSVSIPLTIARSLSTEDSSQSRRVLLSGFGVGLSWCNAVIESKGFENLGVYEYKQ